MDQQKSDDEFVVAAYEKLFESKHHYDNLSWLVAGVTLLFAGTLIAYIPNLKTDQLCWRLLQRLVVAGFIWFLLWWWYMIYQRNRFWAEAVNEAIRDIERRFGVRGAGTAFSIADANKAVVLKNTDEKGTVLRPPYTERLLAGSMHSTLKGIMWGVGILAGLAVVLG